MKGLILFSVLIFSAFGIIESYAACTDAAASGIDWSSCDLSGTDKSMTNLQGSDLSGGKFVGTIFSNADMTGADMSDADFENADFAGTTLVGVDLSGSNLLGANLQGADLTGADLTGASILLVVTCSPPTSGDWVIDSTCTLANTATAPGNVIVQNNAVLTIEGITLDIDFASFTLTVKSGGGVLIKSGGTIT